jgi:hypothetical protein
MSRNAGQVRAGTPRGHWLVLALIVLVVLVGIIYLLSHLSAADSEMYPTSMLRQNLENLHLRC